MEEEEGESSGPPPEGIDEEGKGEFIRSRGTELGLSDRLYFPQEI